MSDHHVTSADIPVNGEHLDPAKVSKLKTICLAIMALGTLASYVVFLMGNNPSFQKIAGIYSYSWVFAVFFFFTLSIGGCFWTLLHNVTNSGWGTSVRRIFENLGSTLPWMLIFAAPLALPQVQHYLFEWMNEHRAAVGPSREEALHHTNHLLANKYFYMNIPFWYGRFFFYFVGLGAVIIGMRKLSTDQDKDDAPGTWRLFKARFHSTYTFIIFAITITFAGFDWLMGQDYTWFSTMWGVYLFAGSALNSMAVIILTAVWLKNNGYLKNVVSEEHFHVKGKLLFAFTIFWAYVSFSQYFLIWYANVTEETKYFLIRNTGGWNTGMICLVFGHFVIPFVALLQSRWKRNWNILAWISIYTLVMHVLDHYLITIPERGISLGNIEPTVFGKIQPTIPGAFVGDIIAFVTVGAGFLFFYLRAMGQHALYPHRDPRILESANISN
ncbi:hypothetical protein KBB96_13400 [Luteolibacter ambystomatis]|uniref:Quinol:cytochrome C oxidoreductase n=1 Tax=Luteolibacter ambystomatis TaxID=2824561 RepID=A0A975G5T6_9BACT|nr:hypothetical protein [Luteolibacter ambystomatis]QUE49864.1 hypothetical protein KBB96_13400 [Luteolibacter ambystomatis]